MSIDVPAPETAPPIDTELPPPVADGREHQLDPRVLPLQRTVGWITAGVIAGISFAMLLVFWVAGSLSAIGILLSGLLWYAAVGLLAWHMHRWPAIEYRYASYRVDDLGLQIKSGVFWRTVVNVPRSRVQHTDVSQGPLERKYGLGTLVVYTAGTDHARVSLGGLEHGLALRIRSHLLPVGGSDAV
jgi:membrane protein YdbS with pleckstrin-like domain